MSEERALPTSDKLPSLFKANEDLSDTEFDNIFNDVVSESSTLSKSSKNTKKTKSSIDRNNTPNSTIPKSLNVNNSPHQGLLVTCSNETVAARTVQLLHNGGKYEENTVVTAIGQPIVVAEELGEITAINLSNNGQWLSLIHI